MSSLGISRKIALVIAAAASLLGVAWSGENGQPAYTDMDVELNTTTAVAPSACQAGDSKSCTIFLGKHGDLSNCVQGLDVCSGGEWTGCIDEASLSENPELLSQLSAAE